MSRYKIQVNSSKVQHTVQQAFWLTCVLALWLWPPMFAGQWLLQLALSVLMLLGMPKTMVVTQWHMTMDDSGQLHWLREDNWQPFQLLGSSVCSDWFCYLVLEPLEPHFCDAKKQRIWVFYDSVDDKSYRRLCRVILRMRRL